MEKEIAELKARIKKLEEQADEDYKYYAVMALFINQFWKDTITIYKVLMKGFNYTEEDIEKISVANDEFIKHSFASTLFEFVGEAINTAKESNELAETIRTIIRNKGAQNGR